MVVVAVLTAGLIGGGIAGVSALASADRPESAASPPATNETTTDPTTDTTDDTTDEGPDEQPPTTAADDAPDDAPEAPERTDVDGEILIDDGDGEPTVIDLGELDVGVFERLHECLGLPRYGDFDGGELPLDDLDLDRLLEDLPFDPEDFGDFEVFDGIDGGVTVTGPDGVSVVDLGEDGSVTITKADGEITIETTGDATVTELTDLIGDFHFDTSGELDGEMQQRIDEIFEGFPDLDELLDRGDFDLPALDDIQECVDEVLGD